MIQIEAIKRAIELLEAVSRYFAENEDGDVASATVFYDDTECDGCCLGEDCQAAAEALQNALRAA